jgi:hypothetical protein
MIRTGCVGQPSANVGEENREDDRNADARLARKHAKKGYRPQSLIIPSSIENAPCPTISILCYYWHIVNNLVLVQILITPQQAKFGLEI